MKNKIVTPAVLLKEHSFACFVICKRAEEGIKRSYWKTDRHCPCVDFSGVDLVYLEWGKKAHFVRNCS